LAGLFLRMNASPTRLALLRIDMTRR